jgi:hypothetical protein
VPIRRSRPPQWAHARTSIANARCIKAAQRDVDYGPPAPDRGRVPSQAQESAVEAVTLEILFAGKLWHRLLGGQCLSLTDYVVVTGTRGGATAAGGPFMLPSLSTWRP